MMEIQLLKDKTVAPSDEMLARALGTVWPVFEQFRSMIPLIFKVGRESQFADVMKACEFKVTAK